MDVGFVCERCSSFIPLSDAACSACGAPLSPASAAAAADSRPAAPLAAGPGPAAAPPKEAAMSGMRACPSCGTMIPVEHRFCGGCGARVAPVAEPPGGGRTMFFGAMQTPGRARLILIKGEGLDGVAYHLNAAEHVAGRIEGAILFEEDPLMSPRHANFFYRESHLFVRDEGSSNGVFIRIRGPVTADSGATFLVGEQLLQVEAVPLDLAPTPDAEGTYFYASPKRPAKLKMIQRLRGGDVGMIYRARNESITVGREGNDVNFPEDLFISGRHASIAVTPDGRFVITDLGSKNGTFLRVVDEAPLAHGDYVFLGQQLLRVEIT
ncbi:MAG TPA: FHA domain-containing protein [Polyangia bacterium]